jgi:hypothetical protein
MKKDVAKDSINEEEVQTDIVVPAPDDSKKVETHAEDEPSPVTIIDKMKKWLAGFVSETEE